MSELLSNDIRTETLGQINAELQRQYNKWGEQVHPPAIWLAILTEEVGELAQAILRENFPGDKRHGDSTIEAELLQVAAVAIQWLQARKQAREEAAP